MATKGLEDVSEGDTCSSEDDSGTDKSDGSPQPAVQNHYQAAAYSMEEAYTDHGFVGGYNFTTTCLYSLFLKKSEKFCGFS